MEVYLLRGRCLQDARTGAWCTGLQKKGIRIVENVERIASRAVITAQILAQPFHRGPFGVEQALVCYHRTGDFLDSLRADSLHPLREEGFRFGREVRGAQRGVAVALDINIPLEDTILQHTVVEHGGREAVRLAQ